MGMFEERVKRIEREVESLRIIKCDKCRDGGVGYLDTTDVDRAIERYSPGSTANRKYDGPYDRDLKCRACGGAPGTVIKMVVPGLTPRTADAV